MVLRGMAHLGHPTPLDTAVFSRLTVKRRVWPYGVWYCCAPSLPLDAAVRSCFDGQGKRIILRGLVPLCRSIPPPCGGILSLDGRTEGMVLRGLVLLCPLPPSCDVCIVSF